MTYHPRPDLENTPVKTIKIASPTACNPAKTVLISSLESHEFVRLNSNTTDFWSLERLKRQFSL